MKIRYNSVVFIEREQRHIHADETNLQGEFHLNFLILQKAVSTFYIKEGRIFTSLLIINGTVKGNANYLQF